MENTYEKITLDNGVRLLLERIPWLRSAAAGIWVDNGSRYETPQESGISHYIEHMMFKGTEKRTAAEIASEMDRIGGQVNAFTTKECTSYYLRTLDVHLAGALDVLNDMFFHSSFKQQDADLERGVIYEEIDMYEDTPDELASERLLAAVFEGHPLGMPILGTKESLGKLKSEDLHRYVDTHYTPEGTVVAISGSFDDQIIKMLRDTFGGMHKRPRHACPPAGYRPAFAVREKPIEQNHLCIGFEGLSYGDPRRYASQVFSNILGGSMSSRLFQRVREESGLCYSIYSYATAHADTGIFGVYMALSRDTEARALKMTREEIERLVQDGPTEDELERAREQIKANILMGLESTVTRMNHIGRSELLLGRINTTDEIIALYDAVDMEAVRSVGRALCDFDKISFSAVGHVNAAESYREILGKR